MLNQVYATKLSMSQAFKEGKRIPLTILSVETHTVSGSRTDDKNGYQAQVISLGEKTKKGKTTPKHIKEVRTSIELEKNSIVNLEEILTPGTIVNVTAKSKGKGFAGVMKRHGFAGGPRTHGQSDRQRAPGSIGRGTIPGRVIKGTKMAGRMGNENVCIRNLEIFSYDKDKGILQITGAIPGSRGALTKISIIKQTSNQ